MNKKERRLALATAMQSAAEDMVVVESLDNQVADGKTKTLMGLLKKVGGPGGGERAAARTHACSRACTRARSRQCRTVSTAPAPEAPAAPAPAAPGPG